MKSSHTTSLVFFGLVAIASLACPDYVHAGVSYQDPAGGWRYKYNGILNGSMNGLPPGYGLGNNGPALDGAWQHDQGDKWDGSGIDDTGPKPGGPAPGGVEAFLETGTSYIRIQDAGNPEEHGWEQGATDPQNSNRRINFGHKMEQDGPLPNQLVLDEGITISFRTRVPDSGPLDDIYTLDSNSMPVVLPWGSVGGGGYPIHDDGRGMFYVVQNDPGFFNTDSAISFSLMTSADRALYTPLSANAQLAAGTKGGLIMNNLAGPAPQAQVDTFSAGGLNLLEMEDADLRNFQEFWITIRGNDEAAGTHEVNVYLNGSTTPITFNVTALDDGKAAYSNNAWLAMGLSSSALFGVVDVDFYAYSLGVIEPVPAPPMQMPDLNMDGVVNIFDINLVSANWGGSGPAGDANKDGMVNIFDINLISANWTPAPGGGSAVPEPATLILALSGLLSLVLWRRRQRRA